MSLKKIVGILAIALLVWFVVTQPTTAAGSVQSIGGTLESWAQNVTSFLTQIVT